MLTRKYQAPSYGWNVPKILAELTVALNNQAPAWGWCDEAHTILQLSVPDWVDETLLDEIVYNHHPGEEYSTAAIVTAGGESRIDGSGMHTNPAAGGTSEFRNLRGDITIDESTSPATFTGSGAVDCWPAIEVLAGVYAVWFCLNDGAVTYYVSSSDGKLYSGAGTVVQDDDGITLLAVNIYNDANLLKWVTSDGLKVADILGWINASTTPNRDGNLTLSATAEPGGTGSAYLELSAVRGGAVSSWPMIRISDQYTFSDPIFLYTDQWGNSGSLRFGDEFGQANHNNDAGERTICTRPVAGSSGGTTGGCQIDLWVYVSNTTGTGRNVTFKYYYDNTLLVSSGALAIANGTSQVFHIIGRLGFFSTTSQVFAGLVVTETATTELLGSGSEDNTADKDFTVTATLSAASASLVHVFVGGVADGPYKH